MISSIRVYGFSRRSNSSVVLLQCDAGDEERLCLCNSLNNFHSCINFVVTLRDGKLIEEAWNGDEFFLRKSYNQFIRHESIDVRDILCILEIAVWRWNQIMAYDSDDASAKLKLKVSLVRLATFDRCWWKIDWAKAENYKNLWNIVNQIANIRIDGKLLNIFRRHTELWNWMVNQIYCPNNRRKIYITIFFSHFNFVTLFFHISQLNSVILSSSLNKLKTSTNGKILVMRISREISKMNEVKWKSMIFFVCSLTVFSMSIVFHHFENRWFVVG